MSKIIKTFGKYLWRKSLNFQYFPANSFLQLDSQLHCSSSLSTTRHVHSGAGTGTHSTCSIESSVRLSSSVNSSDSGFSDKRRSSLSDVTAHVPDYYPQFSHVLRPRKNASAFPVNTDLLIVDYENFHEIKFQSDNSAEKIFGIEIYHNWTPVGWTPGRKITDQMCRAVAILENATRQIKSVRLRILKIKICLRV